MRCCECDQEIETVVGSAFELTGWEQERTGGGTHHVLWRKRTGRVMCRTCVLRKKAGAQQETLA